MATPLGVYLSDGRHTGGATLLGLFLSGVTLAAMGLLAQAAADSLVRAMPGVASAAGLLPALFMLVLLRLTPLAGTHAAEHQVVHCVERGWPLTPECVRQMPRVHPRCGTNLCVGLLIFIALFVGAFHAMQSAGWATDDSALLSLLLAAPLAWAARQPIGGWVQQHFATRVATDAQIANAIFAANQVLERRAHDASRFHVWYRRIPNVALVPLLFGYAALLCPLMLAAQRWPWLGTLL